jgi:uncharacterized protein YndB with AHSA1/START domain
MSSRVLVALRVPGPPDRAFAVFTQEIAAWWRPSPLFAVTPRSTGVMAIEPPGDGGPGRIVERLANGKVFVIGEITSWEPGRRLAFGWRQASFAPDQHTRVEVCFEAVDDGTRVTVEHIGWDSVPVAHVARHNLPDPLFGRYLADWWRTLLIAMGERL